MQFRSFPKRPGLDISILGLGCTRWPVLEEDPSRIDEDAATQLLREAIAAGVNYLDTAWCYHAGRSDPCVARALAGGWRRRVVLAAKAPVSAVREEADWERILDATLDRLATDHLDFYVLALTRERWNAAQRLGGLHPLERARSDGRVAHLGFSFQGSLSDFRAILAGYDWGSCELDLNFVDEHRQLGREALRAAAERGVGVVVADPLRGNALANPPPVVEDAWARSDRRWSPAAWALRWVWNQPEVVTAVVGPTSADTLREGALAAANAAALSAQDLERIEDVRAAYRAKRRVPCASCGACQQCWRNISIPTVLSLYNDAMFESKAAPVAKYRAIVAGGAGADQCTACGECEVVCPEQISIVERLREAHAYLTS